MAKIENPNLTKRDYFAGLAMQELIRHPYFARANEIPDYDDVARVSVYFADALCDALKQKSE